MILWTIILQVNLILPVIFLATCIFLIVVSMFLSPAKEVLIATAIILSGVPVYFICIYWRAKPQWMKRIEGKYKLKPAPCVSANQLQNNELITDHLFKFTETLDWYTAMVFNAVMVLDENVLEKTN